MLISELVQDARVTVSKLDDPDISNEQVTYVLRQAMRILSAKTGIKFTVTGTTWDTWDITDPIVDDALIAIIVLQAKYLIHSSSLTIKTKVGPILVEYDPKTLDRELEILDDLIEAYAAENNLTLPNGFTVVSMNEYDMVLNPDVVINTVEGAEFGNIFREFWN